MKEEVSNTSREKNTVIRYGIINVIKNYSNQEIDEEYSLQNLSIDSIIFVKMILKLEETFHFQADNYLLTINNFPTIKSFIEYIISKIDMIES